MGASTQGSWEVAPAGDSLGHPLGHIPPTKPPCWADGLHCDCLGIESRRESGIWGCPTPATWS